MISLPYYTTAAGLEEKTRVRLSFMSEKVLDPLYFHAGLFVPKTGMICPSWRFCTSPVRTTYLTSSNISSTTSRSRSQNARMLHPNVFLLRVHPQAAFPDISSRANEMSVRICLPVGVSRCTEVPLRVIQPTILTIVPHRAEVSCGAVGVVKPFHHIYIDV